MKKVIYLFFFPGLFAMSCKKDSFTNPSVASLAIINAVVGGDDVRLGSNETITYNNTYKGLGVVVNNSSLYVWPVGDSLHPYFTASKFEIENRGSYSLFLGGTPNAVDGILVKDDMPYHTDSTWGVRIVNLSPNSGAFNITLSTSPTVNEVSNLIYKQLTDFKIYPGKASNTKYTFQVRKTSDNSIVTSYTLSTPRFANVTLVINGLVDSSPAIEIIRVNNDRF